jgi:UDP-glucose 4-epimerase
VRTAVIGGAGFIGSHVVDHLLDEGHDVVVVDLVEPHRDVEAHAVDILDVDGLVGVTEGCDVIFHLAAVSNVNEVADDPTHAVTVNVSGTAAVWEAARRNRVGRAVFASTVWVYAAAVGAGGLDETAPFDLATTGHIYTSTKIASEMIVHNHFDLYGQPFTILRYGIPFGPRMRDELVIPRFVRMGLAGQPLTIHGDGAQYRNYVYVDDLAHAHVLALSEEAENEVFNLEGPEPVSIRRIAETVREVLDRPVQIDRTPARAGDYQGRDVSSARARQLLGWRPQVPFEEGLRRYVDWYLAEQEPAPDTAAER